MLKPSFIKLPTSIKPLGLARDYACASYNGNTDFSCSPYGSNGNVDEQTKQKPSVDIVDIAEDVISGVITGVILT